MKFFVPEKTHVGMDSFVQVQSIAKNLIPEDILNSENVSYQLQSPSLWRRGQLVWMPPLGSRPLPPAADRCFSLASPRTASIPSTRWQELRRRWSAAGRTQGLGLTLVYQGCFARKCLQPQKGLFLWPDVEWDEATTWVQGAQTPNGLLLQVKRKQFSLSWQHGVPRSSVFFWRQG